jgi:ABC-type lipoprotein release transport system permease subunit
MNFLIKMSLRNLLRQKRRNLLLCMAMVVGITILVVCGSFSHGISDVLLNRIIASMNGHVSIQFAEAGSYNKQVFHNGAFVDSVIKKNVREIDKIEEGIVVFGRIIGKGKSDNVMLQGISDDEINNRSGANTKGLSMVEGRLSDLSRTDVENPICISFDKAEYLHVTLGDVIRVRFSDLNGQNNAERLTIVGIFKPDNSFTSMSLFLKPDKIKSMMGYKANDIGSVNIMLKHAKRDAVKVADELQRALRPGIAVINGSVRLHDAVAGCSLFGLKNDSLGNTIVSKELIITGKDSIIKVMEKGALISDSLASKIQAGQGDTCMFSFYSQRDSGIVACDFRVCGIFKSTPGIGGNTILIRDREFYAIFYGHWPVKDSKRPEQNSMVSDEFRKALSPEWLLLERSHSSDDAKKKLIEIDERNFPGVAVYVESMFEMASDVLSLQYALDMIVVCAVLLLFLILFIGVGNTLRMVIKERVREIGTMQAIGMQKTDVLVLFILETMFLSFFSGIAGNGIGLLTIFGLSQFDINMSDSPLGMFLVKNHIHFVPSLGSSILYVVILVLLTAIVTFTQVRGAANRSPSESLRRYE